MHAGVDTDGAAATKPPQPTENESEIKSEDGE